MKKFTAVIATALFLSACSDSSAQETAAGKPILRYQGTANTVTPWELADDLGFMEDIELEWVGDTTSGPENIQATMTNDIEFGGAFNGAILQLQRAGAEVTSVIHYYGSNEETYSGYYVTEDSSLNDAADLIGHNVGVNTLGAHHEFAVIEYARQSGLSEAEIAEIGLVIMPPASGEQALRSRQLEATQLGGILRDKALEVGGIRLYLKTSICLVHLMQAVSCFEMIIFLKTLKQSLHLFQVWQKRLSGRKKGPFQMCKTG
ncbi:ABC transporter substrate-binding protein [Bacillus sp. JCM 19041]|uniref:ABC transporter substrate-binding protein n=1 Tax=Bacillus sp. JCM 19041 TaxID=1460637 RepID=UPI000AEB8D77